MKKLNELYCDCASCAEFGGNIKVKDCINGCINYKELKEWAREWVEKFYNVDLRYNRDPKEDMIDYFDNNEGHYVCDKCYRALKKGR